MSNPVDDLRHLADRYGNVKVTVTFEEAVTAFLFASENSDYLSSGSAETFVAKITAPVIDEILATKDYESTLIILRSAVGGGENDV